MQRPTNFEERWFDAGSSTSAEGSALHAQHKAAEPLPQRWLELLAMVDAALAIDVLSPPTQPEQSGVGVRSLSVSGEAWRSCGAGSSTVAEGGSASTSTSVPQAATQAPDLTRSVRLGLGAVLSEELAATEPAPPSLMKLLARLEERIQADIELGRSYTAVERAVAEMMRLSRTDHE